ncbi:MAG: NUDIX domain-containing protein [Mariprofundales bacterium]
MNALSERNEQTEQQFLAEYNVDKYRKPSATVDVIIFTVITKQLQVLLIKRAGHPYKDCWALPGGFIQVPEDADLEAAARRELNEETGTEVVYLEQLGSYGSQQRDPRNWTLTVAYFALLPAESLHVQHGSDAAKAEWHAVHDNDVDVDLAFDHAKIMSDAVMRLRAKIEYTSIAAHLLPPAFSLSELQQMYEILLQAPLAKSAFRRRLREAGFVQAIDGEKRSGRNRPAQLYRLTPNHDSTLFFPRSMVRQT